MTDFYTIAALVLCEDFAANTSAPAPTAMCQHIELCSHGPGNLLQHGSFNLQLTLYKIRFRVAAIRAILAIGFGLTWQWSKEGLC